MVLICRNPLAELSLFYDMVVCKEDLDSTHKFKAEKSLKLGILAIDDGLLTEQQLESILDHQKEVADAGLFGEIAINMKLLSKEQVDELLKKQREYDKIIGQILVLSGVLSNNEKEEELKQFHTKVPKNN